MTAYINTKRWKHVLENKLLETYIMLYTNTVHEKSNCTRTNMNSAPRYNIKYMCKTS